MAVEVARRGGAMIREEFHRAGGPRGHGDHAEVDLEVEEVIRRRLLAAFPDWGYRGEETGSTGLDPPPRYIWLVDPNDGTRSFLQGHRGSSVSIALLRDREPVLGVVYAPCAPDDDGDLIAWATGCGPVHRNGQAVARAPWPGELGAYEDILVSQDADRAPRANLHFAAPARFRPMTSIAYRLALTAAGDASVGTSFSGAGDWDYAGGHALLRATGGDLFHGDGKPARYSPRGESRGYSCFGGARHLVAPLLQRAWSHRFRREPPDPEVPRALRSGPPKPGTALADARRLRRAQGCLLGQLVGDSLGSLVEFQSPAAIRARYPDEVRDLADGGTWGTLAGQPTDDSELALMLARTLAAEGRYDADAVARAYGYWYRSRPFDIGETIGRALSTLPDFGPWSRPPRGAAERAQSAANRLSQANGSLMRISPLGVWGHAQEPDTLADLARLDSSLTHPNPVCQEACAVFVVAIAHAVHTGTGAREVFHWARDWAQRSCREPPVVDALVAAERRPPDDFMTNQGWVLIALQNAFYRLLHAPDAEAGIVATVMAGGDTDTNAAIAGALLGAVYGRDGLPWRWRRLILSCHPLAGIPGILRPRPEPFWPADAMDLAERLLIAGQQLT